jgi:hypothetical protein
MSYGILIDNGSGETVIDSESQVMVVSQSGTKTSDWIPNYYTTNRGFDFNSLISPDKGTFVKIQDGQTIGFSTIKVLSSGVTWATYSVYTNGAESLDYIVVDLASNVSTSGGYGLEVYRSNSSLVYSTSQQLMPANGKTVNLSSTGSVTILSGDCWVSMPWFGPFGIDPDGAGGPAGTFMLTPSVKRTGNTLEYEQLGIGQIGSTGFQPYAIPNTALTIIQPVP